MAAYAKLNEQHVPRSHIRRRCGDSISRVTTGWGASLVIVRGRNPESSIGCPSDDAEPVVTATQDAEDGGPVIGVLGRTRREAGYYDR
jgi:hypothetical protein